MSELERRLGFRNRLTRPFRVGLLADSRSQGELRPARQQSSSHQVQIGQRKQGEAARRVLGQATITHLGEAPQPLHHMESMFATARQRERARLMVRWYSLSGWYRPTG